MALALTTQIGTSPASAIYTCTTSGSQIGTAITTIMVCNTSSSTTANLTLYAVPSSGGAGTSIGTAANANMIVNALPIPPNETVSFDQEKLVLGPYDSIQAFSSVATTLSITISTLPV